MKVDYQVVVVGAGPAGCAAANYLARRGVEVALVEKAQVPGQRNVTGGVLYTDYLPGYSFGDAFPGFREEAPLERRIVSHEVVILSEPRRNNGKVSYRVGEIGEDSFLSRLGVAGFSEAGGEAYSVLRARLDKWMAAKVSENGGGRRHFHERGGPVPGEWEDQGCRDQLRDHYLQPRDRRQRRHF
jgi:electron transfer flavoprotein-quinone oxidoreductase